MDKETIIMSIKPHWASKILQGSKKYEFRKSLPKDLSELKRIIFYISSPNKEIGFSAQVYEIFADNPSLLWDHADIAEKSGMTSDEYFSYFTNNSKKAYAIRLVQLRLLKKPIKITNPPQNWRYLTDEEKEIFG